jgi:hypothetical protein
MMRSFENSHMTHALAMTLPIAFVMLISGSAAAQEAIAHDQPAIVERTPTGPTMTWIIPYPAEAYALPDAAPAVPYSCYRIGRCSAYDLYRFRDRPNRLTRLAPAAPRASIATPLWMPFPPSFVTVTPDENIAPPYKAASQVRDEYRAVGRPIDDPK